MKYAACLAAILMLSSTIGGCGADADSGPTSTPGPSAEAAAYLEEAISVIEQNWLYADQVDWNVVRSEALLEIDDAETPEDTYEEIRSILRDLSDPHAYFVVPEEVAAVASPSLTAPLNPNARLPTGQLLEGGLALIRVPAIRDLGETAELYRRTGVETIQSLDSPETCGWIVDLRGNRGGRMWTMITSVGPLLGDGELGALVTKDGERIVWEYRAGDGIAGGEVVTSAPGYELINPGAPVVVLTDRFTGSSGEGIALAFRGRPDTQSFGEPTAGAVTAPQAFELSDGAAIVVAALWLSDRDGHTFDGPIPPEQPVADDGLRTTRTPVDEDEVLLAAMHWLSVMPPCQK